MDKKTIEGLITRRLEDGEALNAIVDDLMEKLGASKSLPTRKAIVLALGAVYSRGDDSRRGEIVDVLTSIGQPKAAELLGKKYGIPDRENSFERNVAALDAAAAKHPELADKAEEAKQGLAGIEARKGGSDANHAPFLTNTFPRAAKEAELGRWARMLKGGLLDLADLPARGIGAAIPGAGFEAGAMSREENPLSDPSLVPSLFFGGPVAKAGAALGAKALAGLGRAGVQGGANLAGQLLDPNVDALDLGESGFAAGGSLFGDALGLGLSRIKSPTTKAPARMWLEKKAEESDELAGMQLEKFLTLKPTDKTRLRKNAKGEADFNWLLNREGFDGNPIIGPHTTRRGARRNMAAYRQGLDEQRGIVYDAADEDLTKIAKGEAPEYGFEPVSIEDLSNNAQANIRKGFGNRSYATVGESNFTGDEVNRRVSELLDAEMVRASDPTLESGPVFVFKDDAGKYYTAQEVKRLTDKSGNRPFGDADFEDAGIAPATKGGENVGQFYRTENGKEIIGEGGDPLTGEAYVSPRAIAAYRRTNRAEKVRAQNGSQKNEYKHNLSDRAGEELYDALGKSMGRNFKIAAKPENANKLFGGEFRATPEEYSYVIPFDEAMEGKMGDWGNDFWGAYGEAPTISPIKHPLKTIKSVYKYAANSAPAVTKEKADALRRWSALGYSPLLTNSAKMAERLGYLLGREELSEPAKKQDSKIVKSRKRMQAEEDDEIDRRLREMGFRKNGGLDVE